MSSGTDGVDSLVSDTHDFELEDIKYTGKQLLSDFLKRRVPRDDDFWQRFDDTVLRLAEKLDATGALSHLRADYRRVRCLGLMLLPGEQRGPIMA